MAAYKNNHGTVFVNHCETLKAMTNQIKKRILSGAIALAIPVMVLAAMDVLDNIGNSIRSGDAATLSTYLDANVDLTILDKEAMYSKGQAQVVLKDFFTKNPPSGFQLVHKGSSAEGSQYGIGNYNSGASSYRVYYFVKPKGGAVLIQELRFENQK